MVYVASGFVEVVDYVDVALGACPVEWGTALDVLFLDVYVQLLYQVFYHCHVGGLDSVEYGCHLL